MIFDEGKNVGPNKKVFSGDLRYILPYLQAKKHSISSLSYVIFSRASRGDKFPLLNQEHFYTSDVAAYSPEGEIKIVLDYNGLGEKGEGAILNDGALLINKKEFDDFSGPRFKTKEIHGKSLLKVNKGELKVSPLLEILLRKKGIIENYVSALSFDQWYTFGGPESGELIEASLMGLYLDTKKDFYKVRPICIESVARGSDINAWGGFDSGYAQYLTYHTPSMGVRKSPNKNITNLPKKKLEIEILSNEDANTPILVPLFP